MEKLSDADLITAVRICCDLSGTYGCSECPAEKWCLETHKDILCELEERLSDLRSSNLRLGEMWSSCGVAQIGGVGMSEKLKVEYDAATKAWFKNQPKWMVTTVVKCEKCGLWYKSDLGHKCEKEVK